MQGGLHLDYSGNRIRPRSAFLSNMRCAVTCISDAILTTTHCVVPARCPGCAREPSGALSGVDEPEKSDAIMVLAGETNVRSARALELLRQGVAPRGF